MSCAPCPCKSSQRYPSVSRRTWVSPCTPWCPCKSSQECHPMSSRTPRPSINSQSCSPCPLATSPSPYKCSQGCPLCPSARSQSYPTVSLRPPCIPCISRVPAKVSRAVSPIPVCQCPFPAVSPRAPRGRALRGPAPRPGGRWGGGGAAPGRRRHRSERAERSRRGRSGAGVAMGRRGPAALGTLLLLGTLLGVSGAGGPGCVGLGSPHRAGRSRKGVGGPELESREGLGDR